jgi:hypothetical protein
MLSGGRKWSSAVTKVSKKLQVGLVQHGAGAGQRLADPPREPGRGQPQRQHRQRRGQSARPPGGQRHRDGERGEWRDPHACIGVGQLVHRRGLLPALGLQRQLPLQQPPVREAHAPHRARDRVEAEPRLVGQAGERQRRLAGAAQHGGQRSTQVLRPGQVLGLAHGIRQHGEQTRHEEDGDGCQRPQPGRLQHRPPQHESRDQRRRRQAAPQVVQDLAA